MIECVTRKTRRKREIKQNRSWSVINSKTTQNTNPVNVLWAHSIQQILIMITKTPFDWICASKTHLFSSHASFSVVISKWLFYCIIQIDERKIAHAFSCIIEIGIALWGDCVAPIIFNLIDWNKQRIRRQPQRQPFPFVQWTGIKLMLNFKFNVHYWWTFQIKFNNIEKVVLAHSTSLLPTSSFSFWPNSSPNLWCS